MNSTYEFTLKDEPKVKMKNFLGTKSWRNFFLGLKHKVVMFIGTKNIFNPKIYWTFNNLTIHQWHHTAHNKLSLIKYSTSTFLSDVGHVTYTCTQQTPPQVRVHQFIIFTPQMKALWPAHTYTCTAVVALNGIRRLNTLSIRLSTQGVGRTSTIIPLLGHEGSLGDHPHLGQSNHTSERDTTLLPKTMRQ